MVKPMVEPSPHADRPSGDFVLHSQLLGPLPILNHFMDRIGVREALDAHVPADDARLRLAPATALGVVVANLAVCHEPLYALGEWARPYDPAVLGLGEGEAEALNDDRVGRCLSRLFDADRAGLLTDVVLRAVRAFGIDCSQLHNDSTSVTFTGAYRGATGRPRGGKATAAICHGYNKDYRPDLKQLVWILTVCADGAVPLVHRVASGNTSDDVTHVGTWDALVALVGRSDFLYVADSKLCNRQAMDHIASRGGRFVTVLPRTRREDRWFRDWVTRNTPEWTEATRHRDRRAGMGEDVVSTFESPLGSSEGYRVIWVHSSTKKSADAATRARRIERAEAALSDLVRRLVGPKCRMKTRVAVEAEVALALDEHHAAGYFETWVVEEVDKTYRAEHPGTPGPNTKFRQSTRPRFRLTWKLRNHVVRDDAASDGCWPLITNDSKLSPAEVVAAYKYQPNLERRHAQLKGPQAVAPVLLRDPARIEALLCCHFLALLIEALIERQIRLAMATSKTTAIPLYPEDRDCAAPSATRVLEIFAGVSRHRLIHRGSVVQVFEPTLTPLQEQVLKLLGVPLTAYRRS
ncbi:MAG: IS1634 family transposase [Acidimicrobiales bacterium]